MAVSPRLAWQKPINLPNGKGDPVLDDVPKKSGVYVFFRQHGNAVQVFYVGKALNLRSRIKTQLNNHNLMTAISRARNGARKLVWAELVLRQGQVLELALRAAEKLMIRHFVESGQPIHNVQGRKIPVQKLTNDRHRDVKRFVPSEVTVDA